MRRMRLGALSVVILVTSTLLGGVFGERVLAGGGELGDHLRLYTAILGTIEDQYVDEVQSDRLVSTSIREMLRSLDPHSNFLQTREFSSLQERQRGSYYGLGITVQSIDGNITVVAPFEGTPAHRLGIRAGDMITGIEGKDARGMSVDDAVKQLRGPKGSPVNITITRPGYEELLEFTVVRDEIALHSVPFYFMADERTGYIRLVDFNETTACRPQDPLNCERELEAALTDLRSQGATQMIVDIRDNPGGLLDQAFAVSNLFLKKGQLVVFTRGRTERGRVQLRHGSGQSLRGSPARHAGVPPQRERLRDRRGRHPGPRPGPDRGRVHLWEGAGSDDLAASQRPRLRSRAHDGPLLHPFRSLDSAGLWPYGVRGLRRPTGASGVRRAKR